MIHGFALSNLKGIGIVEEIESSLLSVGFIFLLLLHGISRKLNLKANSKNSE